MNSVYCDALIKVHLFSGGSCNSISASNRSHPKGKPAALWKAKACYCSMKFHIAVCPAGCSSPRFFKPSPAAQTSLPVWPAPVKNTSVQLGWQSYIKPRDQRVPAEGRDCVNNRWSFTGWLSAYRFTQNIVFRAEPPSSNIQNNVRNSPDEYFLACIFSWILVSFKGIIHPKMKDCWQCTRPQAIQDLMSVFQHENKFGDL